LSVWGKWQESADWLAAWGLNRSRDFRPSAPGKGGDAALSSHFATSGDLSGPARGLTANPITLLWFGFPLDLPDVSGTIFRVSAFTAPARDYVRAYSPVGPEGPK